MMLQGAVVTLHCTKQIDTIVTVYYYLLQYQT